jgi:hypothetical protein
MFGWLRKLTGQGEPQNETTAEARVFDVDVPSPKSPITLPTELVNEAPQRPAAAPTPQPSAPVTPPAAAAPTPPAPQPVAAEPAPAAPRASEPADYVTPEPPTVAVPERPRATTRREAAEARRVAEPAATVPAPAEPQAVAAPAAPQVAEASVAAEQQVAPEQPVGHEQQSAAPQAELADDDFDALESAADEHDEHEHAADECDDAPAQASRAGLIPTPSGRPAMPLSAHPNFAGLGLAPAPQQPPRMLDPVAALSPEAQRELLSLFDDLFGPRGRYRLEWRTARKPGDDAVFAEIMAADLVRRVQNAIADVAELERPEPLRAIERRKDDGEEFQRAS